MSADDRISIVVPSRLDHLDLLQGVAEEVARLSGFDEDARLDLGLAVREGAVNAMKHAHRLDASCPVRLEFSPEGDGVRVSILDCGPGFDPAKTPDPRAPENLMRSSGRGLFLIHSLVDEVTFVHHERGMELILVKRLGVERASTGSGA